jgi:phosphoribosylamine--glycine ligase
MSMNILLLGSGGREHALAWKIAQSPLCKQLFIAPGNAGTALCGDNVPIGVGDFPGIEQLVTERNIEMVIVGPEDPLVNGIYDYFQSKDALKKVNVIGPSKEAAQLEGSKAYAKKFMMRHHIPTAAYREFNADNLAEGLAYIDTQTPPIVLKADGLAAGKGVLILESKEEAKKELSEMIAHAKFGKASSRVVIEEFLSGIEFSVFVLTDGVSYKILPEAKDYKRIAEGDKGLNTGGMGAVSPVPFYDEVLKKKVEEHIIKPTINGFAKDGLVYKGFVFFGLIRVNNEPFVIEYNCRMGDPETEVVIPRLDSDIAAHFAAVGDGTLADEKIKFNDRTACTVVVASGGYPDEYEKYKVIKGLDAVTSPDTIIFHSGTKNSGHDTVTNGGRVLAVTSFGKNIPEAVFKSNHTIEQIQFDKKYYRKDIGYEFK